MICNRQIKKEVRLLNQWLKRRLPGIREVIQTAINEAAEVRYSTVKRNAANRGYYCPNPMETVVIGNVSRGRATKGLSEDGESFQYFYDNEGLLRVINYYYGNEMSFQEILEYVDDEVYGIKISSNSIDLLTHEVYRNGRVVQTSYYSRTFFAANNLFERILDVILPYEIMFFTYKYKNDSIYLHEVWNFNSVLGSRIISVFQRFIALVKKNVFIFRHGGILVHEVYRCGYSDTGKMDTLDVLDLSNNPNNTEFEPMDFKGCRSVPFTFEELHMLPKK